jgi:hypothetical protein
MSHIRILKVTVISVALLAFLLICQIDKNVLQQDWSSMEEKKEGRKLNEASRAKSNSTAINSDGKEATFLTESQTGLTRSQKTPPDTTIIILSSLIPTHPSIQIINETFSSVIEMLDGLPSNSPILISVDGLPEQKITTESISRLHRYVKNLRLMFHSNPSVTILNNYEHGHISNSIGVALEVVETEFIYMIQHDFKFVKHINHTALVGAVRERPDAIQIVRFGKKGTSLQNLHAVNCEQVRHVISESHGLYFGLNKWSDNNHFTTKKYYEKLLSQIGPIPRCPEHPMMHSGNNPGMNVSDCPFYFQYMYNWKDGPYVQHLEGRLTLPNTTESKSK